MDKDYWDRFYSTQHPDIERPTPFAMSCQRLLESGQRVVEFGCGNGRDAIFFAQQGLHVIAYDQSEVAIDEVVARVAGMVFRQRPIFVLGDFTRLPPLEGERVDAVYARFTLHSVTASEASRALEWSHANLRIGGNLLLEARSVSGSLYGVGKKLGRDEFLHDGHYRRFLRLSELSQELSDLGFGIETAIESAGLAVHADDDPVVVRLHCTKR